MLTHTHYGLATCALKGPFTPRVSVSVTLVQHTAANVIHG